MERVIAAQADEPRRDHYTEIAGHWLAMDELRLPMVSCGSANWQAPRLAVSIRPEFALRAAGDEALVVKLWLKDEPLPVDAARSCLWLPSQRMEALVPGGTPIVVDVRRRKVHRMGRRRYSRDFGTYLEAEAEGMAVLWQRLAS
jgi:hypothetical protein